MPTGVAVKDWCNTVLGEPFQDEPDKPDDWLKVGGKARVYKRPKEGENGYHFWLKSMDRLIGLEFTIGYVEDNSCNDIDNEYAFPKACLEPIFEGSYEERQAQWIKFHGIKVGSKVKVVRKFNKDEGGFTKTSNQNKSDAVGDSYAVDCIGSNVIWLETGIVCSKGFPYFVLEPI